MKRNNENSKEQLTYDAPVARQFEVDVDIALLQASEGGWGEGGSAGGDGEYVED